MEQVLFEQHVRLVNRVKSIMNGRMRKTLEILTLLTAIACAICLFVLHIIYVTNSSNSNVNCLMTYFDHRNLSNPSSAKHDYDLIKLTVLNATSYPEWEIKRPKCEAESCPNLPYTSRASSNDKVYLFSMDRGSLMLADDTMRYHNFTLLEIEFPSDASCFGPPVTSRVIKEYLGYDLIVLNWAVAAFEGEGFMYKVDNREVYNLNYAGDFVSKKGTSLIDEKNSVRYKEPVVVPALILEVLSKFGVGEKALDLYHLLAAHAAELWHKLEKTEALRPLTSHLAWAFSDEFDSTSASGSTVNSLPNLLYTAATIINTRWRHLSQSVAQLNQYLAFRLGVVFSTTFLFFVTTTLVSYTLRETQERMLRFTHQLQHHINNDLPYWTLVFTHLVESLVFVPIIMGIHFFLVEFFSDQLLAFMVLLMVWMGEVFSVLSLRSRASIRYFPKLFCTYFYLFHIYFFCFPYGFSYLAWVTIMLFVLHATMHLMNSYEIPAFDSGYINARTPRAGLYDPDELAQTIAAEDAAAVAVGNATHASQGAVFRRMQALRRAAEAAGLNGPPRTRRNRSSRARLSGARPDAAQPGASAAANRVRTTSADIPKSKFALAAIPPHNSTRSSSTGAGRPSIGVRAPVPVNSRGPVLAMGRSDSMAQYTDGNFMDEEAALDAEAHASRKNSNAEKPKAKKPKAVKDLSPTSQTTDYHGNTVVIQNTESADSDLGLLLDNSEDERAVYLPTSAQDHDGLLLSESEGSSDSDYYSEEQEEEERRLFVFGSVTGAAATDKTSETPERRNSNADGSSKSPHRKHRRHRDHTQSSAMKPSTAPNIYETLEARRARLNYVAVGGSAAANDAARVRAQQVAANGGAVMGEDTVLNDNGAAIGSSSNGSSTKKRNPNRDSLSDYGFKSSEFSVFGDLLRS